MRVTQTLLSDQALTALRDHLARMAKNQARLATGRQLLAPSDDPGDHAAAARLGARLAATEQFQSQARWAAELLGATDTTLDGFVTIMGRVQELAVSGANGALGAAERAAMAAEVNQLLEEAVDLANAAHAGRYLLGGRETTTAPLTVTRNAAGDITAATWNPRGVDGSIDVDVAETAFVQANLGGTAVLGADADPTFLPALLVQLRDGLLANDQAAVNGLLGGLQTAESRVTTARATAGGRLRGVERVLDDLDTTKLAAQTALSAVMDADIARVAVELSQQEAVYQAALHAAARAIQPSLLEFLR
jgi:flagellar hook-associated protein 3 FlgL